MATHADAVVSSEESDIHDEPHLEGRRVTVRRVHTCVEQRGDDPVTVANQFDLSLADVYHALAYYHDHPEEMRAVTKRREGLHDVAADDPNVAPGPSDAPSGP